MDLKIAGLRVRRGGEFGSKDDTIILQTKIVHCFSEYLEYTIQDAVLANAGAPKESKDDDSYGDMYGSDNYGSEGDAFESAMQNAQGFDNFDDNGPDAANIEEERLIGHLVAHATVPKREHIASLMQQALRGVGSQTLKMILTQEQALFSKMQQEVVLGLLK